MTDQQTGIRNFRRRLVLAIRDQVLHAIDNPKGESLMRGVPEAELGPVSDLSDDQRAAFKSYIASVLDRGIHQFLYGLDTQADGFKILYEKTLLNDNRLLALSDRNTPIAAESAYDSEGKPKVQ